MEYTSLDGFLCIRYKSDPIDLFICCVNVLYLDKDYKSYYLKTYGLSWEDDGYLIKVDNNGEGRIDMLVYYDPEYLFDAIEKVKSRLVDIGIEDTILINKLKKELINGR